MMLFWWMFGEIQWILIGFFSPFLGTACHLLGDTFTYHAFQPMWPLKNNEISFGLCAASDPKANEGLMTLGVTTFIIVFMIVEGVFAQLVTGIIMKI